ncbi:unnamed protein product [Cochlearia groenlandica]
MKYLIIFLIVFALGIIGNVYGDNPTTVLIKNQLDKKHQHQTLFVQCRSKKNRRDPQYLKIGQEYRFDFNINFWGTTLFWCTFKHGANYRFAKVFEVYKHTGKIPQGLVHIWVAREDGIYYSLRSEKLHPLTKVHVWDKA